MDMTSVEERENRIHCYSSDKGSQQGSRDKMEKRMNLSTLIYLASHCDCMKEGAERVKQQK